MKKLKTTFLLNFILSISLCQTGTGIIISGSPLYSSEALSDYVKSPAISDSLCISEIERAKLDILSDKIVFCSPSGLFEGNLRQESELKQLCTKKNIVFGYESLFCVNEPGQIQGCYGGYMDNIIAEKFGADFKKKMLKEADQKLAHSDKIIFWRHCDKMPVIINRNLQNSSEQVVQIDKELYKKLRVQKLLHGYTMSPKIIIGFDINRDGIPSNYFLSQFDEVDQKSNLRYKDVLYKIALKLVKEQKKWIPGEIEGICVNTEMEVSVSFAPKQ